MFDIYCAHCGEPWEQDMLHDVEGMSYMPAAKAFTVQGCTLFQMGKDSACKAAKVVSDIELEAINGAHEMSDYPEEWDYDLAFNIYMIGRI